MAKTIKDVTFKVKAENATAEGLDEVKQSVQETAEETGSSMRNLVPEETGKGLIELNSKAQQAAGVMGTLGGEVGQVAGAATALGGQLSEVIGGFTTFQLTLIGTAAAVVAVGAAMFEWATGPLKAAEEGLQKANQEAQGVTDSFEAAEQTAIDAAAGLDSWDLEARKLKATKSDLETSIGRLKNEMADFSDVGRASFGDVQKAGEFFGKDLRNIVDLQGQTMAGWGAISKAAIEGSTRWKELNAELRTAETEIQKINRALSVRIPMARAFEQAAKDAIEAEAAAEKRKAEAIAKRQRLLRIQQDAELKAMQEGMALDAKEIARQDALQLKEFKDAQEFDAKIIANQEGLNRHLAELENQQALDRELRQDARLQRQADLERKFAEAEKKRLDESTKAFQEAEKRKQDAIANSIALASGAANTAVEMAGMFDLFGEASAKSEEERAKAEAKRLALTNAIKAATEIAEGVAALAMIPPNPFSAAQHFLAASLYGAAAIKAGAAIGGGGGGAAGGGGLGVGGGRAFEGEKPPREQAEGEASGNVIVYVYGHQILGTDAGRMLDNEIQSYRTHQFPGNEQERF